MGEVTIPYKPREWALPFHNSEKRFSILVIHRRAGKTVAAINEMIKRALIEVGNYAYIAPYYNQAKNIVWDFAKKYTRPLPRTKVNESELKIILPNGSKIQLFGADHPDRLRGLDFRGVIYDEYAQQPSNIHGEIIAPMLAANKGWAIWIGTPKGKNAFFDLYHTTENDPKWFRYLLTVEDTGVIEDAEMEELTKHMTQDEIRQELYCSWEASIRGAYYAKQLEQAKQEERICKVPYEPHLKVNTVWDLGVSDATSIIFYQIYGKEIRVIDYEEHSGEGLPFYFNLLENKPYKYGDHWAPHDIKVRELGSGMSRIEIARKSGVNFRIVKNIGIMDGIQAARKVFPQIWIDKEKCSKLIECLMMYHKDFDEKRGVYRDRPVHDWTSHGADAFRYLAVSAKKEPVHKKLPTKYNEFGQPVAYSF